MATIADLVKQYYGITGSGSTNKLTNQAKDACGCADTITKQLSPAQFEAVATWLKNDAIAKGKFAEPRTTKSKPIRGVEAKLIHIRTPDNKRKAVWLEPVFCDALDKVTFGKDKTKWLTDILVNTGDGNLASAVRCSIVKELLV